MSEGTTITGGDPAHPTVFHFHSPGGFPFEVNALAQLAPEAGVHTVGVDRDPLVRSGSRSVADVAVKAVDAAAADLPERFAVLAWSGGAPFAIAAAVLFPERVRRMVLACPLPGWLRGDGAMAAESPRLVTIAAGDLNGVPGAAEMSMLADPWGIDPGAVTCPGTVWYAGRDEVIPRHLIEQVFRGVPHCEMRLFPDDTHFLPMGKWPDLLDLARA